jgi:hypothetical protein
MINIYHISCTSPFSPDKEGSQRKLFKILFNMFLHNNCVSNSIEDRVNIQDVIDNDVKARNKSNIKKLEVDFSIIID